MGDVIQLVQPEEVAVHDPSTTIVEKIDMTDELKKAFEDAGYEVETKE